MFLRQHLTNPAFAVHLKSCLFSLSLRVRRQSSLVHCLLKRLPGEEFQQASPLLATLTLVFLNVPARGLENRIHVSSLGLAELEGRNNASVFPPLRREL